MHTETPRYQLIQPFFCDLGDGDGLVGEDEVIEWDGVPNEFMQPLNEAARVRMEEFLSQLGGKKTDHGQVAYDAYANRPKEDIKMPRKDDDVPLTSEGKKSRIRKARNNADVATAKILEKPEQLRVKKPKRLMGNVDAKEVLHPDTI